MGLWLLIKGGKSVRGVGVIDTRGILLAWIRGWGFGMGGGLGCVC